MKENSLIRLYSTRRFWVHTVKTLRELAIEVLCTERLLDKAALTEIYAEAWASRRVQSVSDYTAEALVVPDHPCREEFDVGDVISGSSVGKRAVETSIHGICHAESYAVDLFWDCIARFTGANMPIQFYDEQCHIARQEAQHFLSWRARLEGGPCPYGSLPTHKGLWRSAAATSHDLLHRLAIINMMHEARGLDTYALTMDKFKRVADDSSAAILAHNFEEEVYHVATGVKWFRFLCDREGKDPVETFQSLVRIHHSAPLRGPFNKNARERAGMTEEWYLPLTASPLPCEDIRLDHDCLS